MRAAGPAVRSYKLAAAQLYYGAYNEVVVVPEARLSLRIQRSLATAIRPLSARCLRLPAPPPPPPQALTGTNVVGDAAAGWFSCGFCAQSSFISADSRSTRHCYCLTPFGADGSAQCHSPLPAPVGVRSSSRGGRRSTLPSPD